MTHDARQAKIKLYGQAHEVLVAALKEFPTEMWQYRPAPDCWTIHEIVIHITDSEANSFGRCRRAIAEPGEAVMAYDEMQWARALDYHARDPQLAVELFRWLRRSSYELIRDQPDEVWSRTIYHPENGIMTLDDWLDVYAAHVPQHVEQMRQVYADWQAARR